MKGLLRELVQIPAPAGHEGRVRQAIQEIITPHVDSIKVDALGNLIARKGRKAADGRHILLSAHMDEIGVIATHIDANGFVRFTSVGALFLRYLPGGHVRFLDGARGLVGVNIEPGQTKFPSMEQMFLDVGASNRQDCPVQVGDLAVFDRPMLEIGNRVVGKSLDNRTGVAVLIEVIRSLGESPHTFTFVFSVQEELSRQGAMTAAFASDAEMAIAVDVTTSGDTPQAARMAVSLGGGPAIKVRDQGMIADARIVRWMADSAEQAGIPHQYEVLELGTTDAQMIQVAREGIPSGCLSIPLRYLHSPAEMVDLNDLAQTYALLTRLLTGKAAF
ncbi:MAG: M42 family metallopeptidase [Anaerolineae bacterium]|nr:M42 family metallopeptidase [Anaerolineae bacterium]